MFSDLVTMMQGVPEGAWLMIGCAYMIVGIICSLSIGRRNLWSPIALFLWPLWLISWPIRAIGRRIKRRPPSSCPACGEYRHPEGFADWGPWFKSTSSMSVQYECRCCGAEVWHERAHDDRVAGWRVLTKPAPQPPGDLKVTMGEQTVTLPRGASATVVNEKLVVSDPDLPPYGSRPDESKRPVTQEQLCHVVFGLCADLGLENVGLNIEGGSMSHDGVRVRDRLDDLAARLDALESKGAGEAEPRVWDIRATSCTLGAFAVDIYGVTYLRGHTSGDSWSLICNPDAVPRVLEIHGEHKRYLVAEVVEQRATNSMWRRGI
jgi:hypothetical protein